MCAASIRFSTKKRWKTIALISEEHDWEPSVAPPAADHRMSLRVAGGEVDVRRQVKAAGGSGGPKSKCGVTVRASGGVRVNRTDRLRSRQVSTGKDRGDQARLYR